MLLIEQTHTVCFGRSCSGFVIICEGVMEGSKLTRETRLEVAHLFHAGLVSSCSFHDNVKHHVTVKKNHSALLRCESAKGQEKALRDRDNHLVNVPFIGLLAGPT